MRVVVSGVLAGVLLAATLVGRKGCFPSGHAQPAPDLERAKDLYDSAEAAMKERRYGDAIRDYGAAYEIAKQPAFFYKIGSANERAGKCDVALIYYRRYLKEGKPSAEFVRLTNDRIKVCGGDPTADSGSGKPIDPRPGPGSGAGPQPKLGSGGKPIDPRPGAGSAGPAPGPGSATEPQPGLGSGSAAPPPLKLGRHKGPWLLVGGSIALVTLGSVLAYSANAAERDVEDLYVGLNGTPPPYNDTTKQRYDNAIAEGERYQTLSIVSFGLAAGMAIGAAVWFVVDKDDARERVLVTPTVTPNSAGVSTTLRF